MIVGSREIATLLEVKPGTVRQWRKRDIGFPEPSQVLATGPVWLEADIVKWARRTGRL